MANEIVKTVKATLEGEYRLSLEKALPKHIPVEKLIQISITALSKTPKLLECNRLSIYKAVMECAQLGLVPDGILGEAYFVPYKGVCQLIAGYRGLMSLAVKSSKVSHIFADNVFENDEFQYERGANPVLRHVPTLNKERGEYLGSYAVANLVDAPSLPAFEFMRADEVEAIHQRSKAKDNGPWVTDYFQMTKKTAVRRLCKFLPMSPEAVQAAVKGEYHDAGVLDGGIRQGLTPGISSFGFQPDKPPTQPAEVLPPDGDPDASQFAGETIDAATGEVLTEQPPGDMSEKEALLASYTEMCESANIKPNKAAHAMGVPRLKEELAKLTAKLEEKQ